MASFFYFRKIYNFYNGTIGLKNKKSHQEDEIMINEAKKLCGAIDEMMDGLKGEFYFDTVCAMNSTDLKLLQSSIQIIEATKKFYMAQAETLYEITQRLDQLLPAREASKPDEI